MYARLTTFQVDPARIGELTAKMGDFKAGTKSMKGVINTYVAWRADGQGMVTAIFDSKASADAAAAQAQGVWAGVAGLLKGAPKVEDFDQAEHLSG